MATTTMAAGDRPGNTPATTLHEIEALFAEEAAAKAYYVANHGRTVKEYLEPGYGAAIARMHDATDAIVAARPTDPPVLAAQLRWLTREIVGVGFDEAHEAPLRHIADQLERLAGGLEQPGPKADALPELPEDVIEQVLRIWSALSPADRKLWLKFGQFLLTSRPYGAPERSFTSSAGKTTISPANIEAIELEVCSVRALLKMADARMSRLIECEADGAWLYVVNALERHLNAIDAALGNEPDDAGGRP